MLHYHNIITSRTNMTAMCELFMNCSKMSQAFGRNKDDCQTWYTKGIIDDIEQILLNNVKYLRLSTYTS